MSTALVLPPRPVETSRPVTEPVTILQARKQVELSHDDATHDRHLNDLIVSAREEWEQDTGYHLIKRNVRLELSAFREFQFHHRPVDSITEIKYFDRDNTPQTLGTSVYSLDQARNILRLNYGQTWPDTVQRYDAVEVTYVLGLHDEPSTVPQVAVQAMRLLIGYYFTNRGDMDGSNDKRAYERLVQKFMRSSYP